MHSQILASSGDGFGLLGNVAQVCACWCSIVAPPPPGGATQEEVVEINHSESCGIFTKSGMAAASGAEQAAADDFKINNEQRSDIPSPLNSSGRAGSS